MLFRKKSLLVLLLLLFVSISSTQAQVIAPFTPVYQITQKGGIVFLANSALGCSANPPLAALSATCSAGSIVAPPTGSLTDNNFFSTYVDIDGSAGTFQSSSDSLNLPVCSEITKAYLFWGASHNNAALTTSNTTCKMKVGSGSYQIITSISSQTNNVGFNTYHSYADVTALLQSGGIKSRVTVADIGSNRIGIDNTFGSWCIAVVYKNDLNTLRQLTVFRGLANVSTGGASTVNVPISGFLTPLSGPVSLELGIYVHDGDRARTGDGLSFKGAAAFIPLNNGINPVSDIMNSTVSYNGTLTPFRLPNMNNTSGLDADIFVPNNTTKNFIGNAATSATFQLTTGSETYLPQMVTTAIDVYEPDVRASITARDVNGGQLVPGDIIEYRVKGINIGSDPSVNTFITDTLDIRANYIPNSVKYVFGAVTGTMSDASGDDRSDYNLVNRTLKFRIGAGATSAIGGTVINSPAGIDSTVITYSVMCTSSCVKIACSPSIQARAYIFGTGATSSNTFNNGSNPGIFDAFGCPIPGTTSSPITATACASPAASNNGPGCLTGNIILTAPSDPDATYSWTGPLSYTSAIQSPTISGLTAGMAGTYNVTLAIPASTCQAVFSTSFTAGVCIPVAVADATTGLQNTPVSGNLGSNDTNLNSPTFSVSAPPSSGTLAINPTTGQYTYTPTPSFTGVTTATYAVCNGINCSTATVTFTMFPPITANPDVISTTPTSTVGGSLLGNDAGLATGIGATYSVTAAPISTATGTMVLDPTTGQYTFTPNPTFAGTVQSSYTVCNTAVLPQQCSTATIAINVFPVPAPVDDATTTVINTPVSGNASTNDAGTAGAQYSIVTQPASGTLAINASTGQYTYTPTPTFTGVATGTYSMCNGLGANCSTAAITVTVYPQVVANPDLISTTPTSTVGGSLAGNDAGVTNTLGATFNYSATPTATSTGTLVVDPATGQYTFTPNPAFSGTTSTTYTVCNTAVNPQVCSTTSIAINVFPVPAPVNDATTTVVNTPVSGNASTNDAGTAGAQYSIVTQPASGTLAINASTGQYTFTPVPSFTGVTSGTYSMCNGLGANCATAAINVTVYPQVVANPDAILTTPTSTVGGNLSSNDAGVTNTLGATFNYSATAPSPATGTLTVDPATGQYTFTPNPTFSGSVATTYTVCNTAVNPQVCSSTSISITVFANPQPVNDATTTILNTPVIANAGTNDAGTAGSNFSITAQSAGGTFSINSATGNYTFTPTPSFTGVATATYNLCNPALSTCSTAVITVTVYPALTANPDAILTTPTSTVGGNLSTNDLGVISTLGATYNFTTTAPSPATGTLTVNPATGQYTFTPNPTFSGSVATTYTVCNTAVNPQVCSSTSISITVFANPQPVNDATNTPQNTPISGNAGANDAGTAGANFSITAQSAGGTFSINAATGNYTFTPTPTFTGVATATYNLCNPALSTCSTAVITVTVFPTLTANPDVIATLPTSTVSGNLSTNDLGVISTLGATYNFTATPVSGTTGTLTVNPSTGQYTFTPNPAFTGTVATTYTVCNTALNPAVCSTSSILISVFATPQPVNDATTTVLNTPVIANAATNDAGVSGGTFSIVAQSTGGTFTMNPATGNYTFTPTSTFTGVATATYQVCNALSSCSTAVINVTVYPLLVANQDIISTTPSVSATGTLLTNDAGISPTLTANYSVTVTQPAASTGTIQLNPTTGQYTFVPNPAFVGSVQTTYTVCNTSVISAQCSNTTIIIRVYPVPGPVNDIGKTMINTPVSGSLATNDTGTASAVYTIVTQPANGTVAVNPSTGQYTFTPTPSFTGVTTATYQMCNGAGLNCSTALLTVTVYPALAANTDTALATPNSTVTGNLATNDAGVLLTGTLTATYNFTATALSPTIGVISLNPATGQYTFVPAASFTGTSATTYTVCNTAVNPQVCSTASIIVVVSPTPAAQPDNNTTVVNTPVSGTVSTNDGGALPVFGPAFTNSQPLPGTGTLTMNPSTGAYTFAPASGFTGTTSATYTLCNLASPPCSTTTITFSVYPNVVAVLDVINTNPTTTVNGTLTTNDQGVLLTGTMTANYSVTATPLNPSTGTLVVNPTTGQYTFTPSGTFVGTTQTTYTICNTSVNPQICSNATIVLNVFPNPAPVNDATTTIQGSPVVANAATNDAGTTGGTFSVIAQSTGGTFTMNPSTGQYTFTPTSTFTGVATATYNLCNGAPVTCSTAVITVTVYPTLVANPDAVNTGTGTPVNGNLLGNDGGIVPGGNYTVTVNPIPSSTGTLLVNPTTGQYTFIPNPSFTGTASTTYTVCNTSVNPQVCSTSTININVLPNPAPVNDATVTISGNPVSGSLATNDGGTAGGTFTIVGQPTGGTVTINPTTGQYTFTPSPSFTGVTTATYQLCNGAPVTCSTAVLTITVYPVLTAVTDVTNTPINTPVSGTLITNDTGIVPIGTYSVSVPILPSSTGTLQVNASTGQYTFTPAPGFTGTVLTTYTVCQVQGTVNLQCSTATLVINVGAVSKVGLAKAISGVVYNTDGTATINYKITVKNLGNQPLTSVSVSDDLGAAYPAPASYTVNGVPSVISGSTELTMESGFNGNSTKLLTVPLTSSLAVGKTDTIQLSVRVKPGSANGSYANSATVTAIGSGSLVSDDSVDGLNPDPDNDGNGNNNTGASTFTFSVPKVGVAKMAGTSVSQGGGCYDVVFKFTVKNFGAQPAYNVSLSDQLSQTFASALSYSIVGTPTCVSGLLQANTLYTGVGTQTNLLAGNSSLAGGATDTVLLKVNYCVTGSASFTNTAKVSASSLPTGGFVSEDVSTEGTNPDPNNDGTPNESTPTVFAPISELFVPDGFSPNNDGVNDVFVVRGLQNFPDNEVSILNRWGNVVYKKKQYDNTWDGTSNSGVTFGGDELPEGTYFYIIDPGNGQKVLKGYVYLSRTVK